MYGGGSDALISPLNDVVVPGVKVVKARDKNSSDSL